MQSSSLHDFCCLPHEIKILSSWHFLVPSKRDYSWNGKNVVNLLEKRKTQVAIIKTFCRMNSLIYVLKQQNFLCNISIVLAKSSCSKKLSHNKGIWIVYQFLNFLLNHFIYSLVIWYMIRKRNKICKLRKQCKSWLKVSSFFH